MANGSKGWGVQRVQRINSKTKVCNCNICDEDNKRTVKKWLVRMLFSVVADVNCGRRSHCHPLQICIWIRWPISQPSLSTWRKRYRNSFAKNNLAILISKIASIKTELSSAKSPNAPTNQPNQCQPYTRSDNIVQPTWKPKRVEPKLPYSQRHRYMTV